MIHVGQCAWSIIEQYINIMVHVQTFDHLRSRTPWKHGAKTELHECHVCPLLLCCIRMYQPNAAHCFSPWKPKDVPCTSPQTVPLRPTSLYYLFSSLTLISVFEWIIQGIPRSLCLIIHLPSWHSLCPSQSWDLKALFHLKQATTTWINSLPLNSTGQMRRFWVSWHVVLSFCLVILFLRECGWRDISVYRQNGMNGILRYFDDETAVRTSIRKERKKNQSHVVNWWWWW